MKLAWREKIRKLIPSTVFPYTNYILIGILVLGFVIRVYKVTSLPLYGDELTMVYDTYSILKTGRDQTGELLPLTFKMGAGRPAGYVYSSIPFVAIFGPTAWGVRGLSIVSGLGIILLMFFLGKRLFSPSGDEASEKVGIIASFLTSISLWDIYLSRGGFEAHYALFLTLFGVVMFLYKKYIPMAIALGLAAFTYPTFKLTIPILGLVLVAYSGIKKILFERGLIASLLILLIFAGFSMRETLKGVSESRFLSLNVFGDASITQNIIQRINEQRNLSTLSEVIKPLIYNRPMAYSRILLDNYMENLSLKFLYLRGDGNPRHNPGEWGMMYLADIPLLFAGLYFLVKFDKKTLVLLIAWILITPLATMLLGETHALRNNLMLPPLILISAFGLSKLPRMISFLMIPIIGIQLALVLVTIYFFAPNKFGSFWSEAAKTASIRAINESRSGQVVLSTKVDNIEYAYPVYAKIDPRLVISQYGKFPKVYGNVKITNE